MANYITRQNAEALIPTQEIRDIIQGVAESSAILQYARRLPNMISKQTRLKILDSLPVAGFVDGDTGLKPTSKLAWKDKFITAEEIAVIIPIPEAVLDDAEYDIWGETRPRIIEAMGNVVDGAILYGKDKPSSWDTALVDQIRQSGNVVTYSANDTLYLQIDSAMSEVEQDGFVPNAIIGGVDLKSAFRRMLDTTGQPITGTDIDSIPKVLIQNGIWDSSNAKFLVGDFNNLVYAIRQDITYKVLTESVISDADGKVILNLAQQDMVALRVVMRLGWAVPNPIQALNNDESTRFPFSLAEASATEPTTQNVTFTVTDGATEPTAIANANVEFGGVSRKTNASGVATFKVVAGKYTFRVNGEGYSEVKGNVTVADSAVSKAIVLQ